MSWTAPYTPAPGDMMTAAIWAPQVRDNLLELRGGGLAISGQATGQIPYASGSAQLASSSTFMYDGTGVLSINAAASGNAMTHKVSGTLKAAFCLSGYAKGDSSTDATILANTGGAVQIMTNGSATAKATFFPSGGWSNDATDPGTDCLRITGTLTVVSGDAHYATTNNFSWNSKTFGTVYLAASDGIVVAVHQHEAFGAAMGLQGFSDASNPPTTVRAQKSCAASESVSITFPVKKGDRYKVEVGADGGTGSAMWWVPNGFNG